MLVLGIAILAAALIPLLTRGSYARLLRTEIHWGWLLAAGLGIQLGLEYYSLPRAYWHNVGFGLLVASYVLILAFCARNLVLRGMGIVFIGIACNALVIALNQGMPVKIPPRYIHDTANVTTVKHHPQQHGEHLLILSDIIILEHPYDVAMSFGDLILAAGICDVAYNTSRNPRKRRRKARRAGNVNTAPAAQTEIDLVVPEVPTPAPFVAREPDPRVEAHGAPSTSVDDFTPKTRAAHRA